MDRLASFVIFFPVFLFSLSFHEYSHGWVANRLGDPTAKFLGRLTMNPLKHIDWIGTFLFPLMMFLMPGLLLFGWAKPVPIDPRNIRGGRRGTLFVALAGPAANLVLALLISALLHLFVQPAPSNTVAILHEMLETGVYLNLMLAAFNLIPLHPLDGGKVMEGLLPAKYLIPFDRIGRYGFLILFLLLYSGLLRYLMAPVLYLARLLLP